MNFKYTHNHELEAKVKKKQVPRGFIRCDYSIVTHCTIDYDVIDNFYPPKRAYSSFEDNTGHADRRTDGHDVL